MDCTRPKREVMADMLRNLLQNRRVSTIVIGLLGAAKIITDMLGWHVITDQQINDIANGAAALLTVITVVMSHVKSTPALEPTVPINSHSITPAAPTTGKDGKIEPEAASNGYARPQ